MTSQVLYQEPIEEAIASLETWLNNWGKSNLFTDYALSSRSLALLLLQKDPVLWSALKQDDEQCREVEIILTVAQNKLEYPVNLAIAQTRQEQARRLESIVLQETKRTQTSLTETLHRFTVNPLTGFPLLVVILYFGVYKFVGEFGAGELVDRIEGFYEGQINPIVNSVTAQIIDTASTLV